MKLIDNRAGGQTVILAAGDSIDSVLESHLDMLTPAVRQAFADPPAWFQGVATRSQIPEFAQWLTRLIEDGQWRLMLHEGFMYERSTLAAFYWHSANVQSAMISLPRDWLSPRMPQGFHHYYSLVDVVHWDACGSAGGLLGSQDQLPLAAFSTPRPKRKGFDPRKCVVWGNSMCGDMLIYTEAGKAGFLSHENGKVQLLGTIEEAIAWVFRQLLENRTPEFDYSRG